MNISVTGAYVYFVIPILGGIPITQTAVSSFIVTVLLCIAFVKLGKNLEKRPGKMQVLVEKGVMMITNLTASAMGKQCPLDTVYGLPLSMQHLRKLYRSDRLSAIGNSRHQLHSCMGSYGFIYYMVQ